MLKNAKLPEPLGSYSSSMKNYWLQITIKNTVITKSLKYCWKLPKCDTQTWSEQMCWETNGADRLAQYGIATGLQFVKRKKKKNHSV